VLIDEQGVFVDRSMHEILPCCMAQHFSVRLYAQVRSPQMYRICTVTKWKSVYSDILYADFVSLVIFYVNLLQV
jgi:hypothetical protein